MNEERPTPPDELKPWYYQYWFLYPVFILWPVWAVLILRSPWHNGLVSGAVAWAMLIVGGYAVGWQQLFQERTLNDFTITIIIPGLTLTVVTQALWFKDKQKLRDSGLQVDSPTLLTAPLKSRRARQRQQGRRRSSRSGRSARGR